MLAVERASDKQKEPKIQVNLNRLGNSYEKVEDFAKMVESQSAKVKEDELLALIWNVTYAVFEV